MYVSVNVLKDLRPKKKASNYDAKQCLLNENVTDWSITQTRDRKLVGIIVAFVDRSLYCPRLLYEQAECYDGN